MRHYISSSAVSHKQKFSRIGNEHIVGFKHTCINKYFLEQAPGRSKTYPDVCFVSLYLIQKILEQFWRQNFGWSNHVDEIELFARGVVGTSCRIGQSVVNADKIHWHFQEVQRLFIESNLQTSGKKHQNYSLHIRV